MDTVLHQLNFLKFSKEDFFKFKTENDNEIILLDSIEQKLKLIRQKISKNSKSSIQNSFEKIDKKSKFAKSWRMSVTVIKKKDLTLLEQFCNDINSNLNKLSPVNFDKISENIIKILENENNGSEILKELIFFTINNIFKKAVFQPIYCPHYVKLLNILDKKFLIRDLIDKKCSEYKNVTSKDNSNSERNTESNIESNTESNIESNTESNSKSSPKPKSFSESLKKNINKEQIKYDDFCKEIKDKKFMEGYSQFIGELYKNSMIKYVTMDASINMFFDNLYDEIEKDSKSNEVEYLIICLTKLYTTIQNNIRFNNREQIIDKFLYIQKKDIIKRLKFKLMDITDKKN